MCRSYGTEVEDFKNGEFELSGWQGAVACAGAGSVRAFGMRSKQDKALEQAKTLAAKTGQPQQVVSVNKDGTTTTITVQPPASRTDERGDHVCGNTARTWSAHSSSFGSEGFRGAAASANQHEHPDGDNADHSDRPEHRRKAQPRGRSVYRRDRGSGVASDNSVLVPKGALVGGIVDVSHRRGHFKGRSLLELRLTSLTLNGQQYQLNTRDLAESKKGKGRRGRP